MTHSAKIFSKKIKLTVMFRLTILVRFHLWVMICRWLISRTKYPVYLLDGDFTLHKPLLSHGPSARFRVAGIYAIPIERACFFRRKRIGGDRSDILRFMWFNMDIKSECRRGQGMRPFIVVRDDKGRGHALLESEIRRQIGVVGLAVGSEFQPATDNGEIHIGVLRVDDRYFAFHITFMTHGPAIRFPVAGVHAVPIKCTSFIDSDNRGGN